jgi:rubrerythrin
MMSKIFPRNLTARAAYRVVGNPESTRLESGVGNCFPGLEFDHRNLDRRFLPGLVVEFNSTDDSPDSTVQLRGARVIALDSGDPALVPTSVATAEEQQALTALQQQIAAADIDPTTQGWFVSAITQSGVRIEMTGPNDQGTVLPFDGLTVWRFVRCLELGEVEVELTARSMPNNAAIPAPVVLKGWRRRFTDPSTGVLSASYQPGELTQSLCSPWTHDFRDCGCFYWASNHPDVVRVEDLPGDPTLPDGQSSDPRRALTRVRWLRSDRSPERSSEARETYGLNRPTEIDHYEINLRWQELPMVLANKEVSSVFRSRPIDSATPYPDADTMATALIELATLEHVLILEYLYAYFSVHTPDEIPDGPTAEFLREDVQFIRHFILLVAVSEMQHLRLVNQLLWELREGKFIDPVKFGKPSLGISPTVPTTGGIRPRALRPLTAETLMDFVAVERPSGLIEGQYARAVATLRTDKRYPEALFQIASRIANDGQDHFLRFRDIQSVMAQYKGTPWLRDLKLSDPADADVKDALQTYTAIIDNLRLAYATGSITDRQHVTAAREAMVVLQTQSEALAAKGSGVPYF